MSSRPDTTNISVQPPRRSGGALAAAAAVAMLAVGALVVSALYASRPDEAPPVAASPSPTGTPSETVAGTAATPSVSPTPAATAAPPATGGGAETYESELGYSVDLPPGWRRSDLVRAEPPPRGDPEMIATEVFTTRTPDDERQAMEDTHVGFGPIHAYTAFIRIYRNSEGLTPKAFAEEEKGMFGLEAVSVEEITFADRGRTSGGRPAARTTWRFPSGSDTFFATYVEDDQERMWVIGFYLAPRDMEVPSGATKEDLLKIVGTFSAPWLRD